MSEKKNHDNEKGMSLIEILPLVIVMTTLFSFLLGAWGIAHKNILSSIAARTYAFDSFNNRANVMYFNDVRSVLNSYELTQSRFHGVGYGNPDFSAPIVPIRYVAGASIARTGPTSLHTNSIWGDNQYQRGAEITTDMGDLDHVWVTVGYGICINANCGGN